MKLYFYITLTFSLFYSSPKAQTWCNPTTFPAIVFNPNTTSSYTIGPEIWLALCGPNTVLYDTLNLHACHFIYVNNNCKLIFKQYECNIQNIIWAKSNSTITILNGSGPVNIRHESSVIINNYSNNIVDDSICSSITFPNYNCFAGINEFRTDNINVKIWPTPSINVLNFQFNNNVPIVDMSIINLLGQTIKELKNWETTKKSINIESIPEGNYFITVKTEQGQKTQKLIILR